MCNENIRIIGNVCIMLGLAVSNAVAHEHRNAIEFHFVNLNSRIAYVMDIAVKSVNSSTVKAIVVVAANEYRLRIRKAQNQFIKSKASCSLPFMVKSPECTIMSACGKSCNRLWQPCVSEICKIFISNAFFADKDKGLLAQFAIQAETIPLLYIKVRHEEDTFAILLK